MGEQREAIRVDIVDSPNPVAEAAALFDHPIDLAATAAFLADERHHLLIGYLADRPAGFVTAVELLHPDKPRPEMFIYELGVDPGFQRLGVATALMQRLVRLCHERGCGEMFVLTDEDNVAARSTYRKVGGEPEQAGLLFHWDWRGEG